MLRTEDVEEGDLIITSGTDGVYPPGLVVGRVTHLEKKEHGMFQGADITPAVDTTRLEEVLVRGQSRTSEMAAAGGAAAESAQMKFLVTVVLALVLLTLESVVVQQVGLGSAAST